MEVNLGKGMGATEEDIRKKRDVLRAIFDQMSQPVIVTAGDGTITGVNAAAAELFGVNLPDLQQKNVLEFFVTRDRKPDGDRIRRLLMEGGQIRNQEAYIMKGAVRWAVLLNVSNFHDLRGNHMAVIGTLTDVNDLVHAAYHDGLTGVMNWSALAKALPNEISAALAEDSPFGVIVVDTDEFKAKNDAYGHAVGDALLKAVAEVLGKAAGPTMVGRSGGDEFMVLVRGDADAVDDTAHRILHGLRAMTVPYNGISLSATASIGWAMLSDVIASHVPVPGADPAGLVRSFADRLRDCADIATYEAKRGGKDRIVRHHQSQLRRTRPPMR